MRLALQVALAVATAAVLFAPAASAQSQAAISINFRGNSGNLVTGPAGAVGNNRELHRALLLWEQDEGLGEDDIRH